MGILSVAVSMALILFLVRKKLNIGLAMAAGAATLALTAPLSLAQAKQALWSAASSQATWDLMLIILLIGMLGYILKASSALKTMVEALLGLLGDPRVLMVAIPGLIGLLTVPGGAIMSAPMVGQLGDEAGISPERKTGINLIYRHIWYLIFPMIASVILAAQLAAITPVQLVAGNVPVIVVGFAASWFFLLRGVPAGDSRGRYSFKHLLRFAVSIMPIAVVLVLYLVCGLWFPAALVVGLLLALVNMPGGDGPLPSRLLAAGLHRAKTMLLPGLKAEMIVVVLGIMVYKEMLEASQLVTAFTGDLVGLGIPLWLLLLVLPFAIGMVTGAHSAAVAIVLPMFLPLLSQSGYLAGVSLIYVSGTLGYLISPIHLCLILTREFYQSQLGKVYRLVLPVVAVMLATALITALLRGL